MENDRDELLVRKFFDENKFDVPDEGFSRRVMRRLPDRARRLNRVWTAVCAVVGVLLFVMFDWAGGIRSCVIDIAGGFSLEPWLPGNIYLLWLLLLSVILLGGYKVLAED